jgi:V8-like Glu-specific endopeptidase
MRTFFLPGKRSLRLAVAGFLLTTAATGSAVAATPTDGPAATGPAATSAVRAPALPSKAPAGALEATGYWTADKMRNAIPADLPDDPKVPTSQDPAPRTGPPSIASRPVAPLGRTPLNEPVPSTAGKVFFSDNGLNYVCSAAAVNNNYKNLVVTAGHCIHSGQGGNWHSNIAFAPSYYNGQSGAGLWNWAAARTFNAWINNSNFSYDQAFFTVWPRNNRSLIDTVGGNGLAINNSTSQPSTRIWGWPAEPPFNGEVPYYCEGTTSASGSTDAALGCNMNGGASGGPWLKDRIDQNLGYIFAATSRRTTSGPQILLATPFNSEVLDMFNQMT